MAKSPPKLTPTEFRDLLVDYVYEVIQDVIKENKKTKSQHIGRGHAPNSELIEDLRIWVACIIGRGQKYAKWFRKRFIKRQEERIAILKQLRDHPLLLDDLPLNKDRLEELIRHNEQELREHQRSRVSSKHGLVKIGTTVIIERFFLMGLTPSIVGDIVYEVFKRFEYQDYGKGGEDDIKLYKEERITESEVLQKDRIRKTFVEPVFKTLYGNL